MAKPLKGTWAVEMEREVLKGKVLGTNLLKQEPGPHTKYRCAKCNKWTTTKAPAKCPRACPKCGYMGGSDPVEQTDFKYIYFERDTENYKHFKTSVWVCKNKRSGDVLGIVRWYSQWRQYCFYPEPHTVFNYDCLQNIRTFMKQLRRKPKPKPEGSE